MPSRSLAGRSLAALVAMLAVAYAATRPHYGGTLRVEIREAIETPDPPQSGPGIADLSPAFAVNRWEAGSRAVFTADDNAPGGRPFLDSVEVRIARPLHDQSIALETGRADIVELGPAELRRQTAGRKVWTSSPVRVVALVFGPRIEDARIREALALAVDRAAIHNVLLQRNGEISGALLPQWISGYAFVFPSTQDLVRARALVAGAAGASRSFSLAVDDPVLRPIADRVALDARNAGLAVSVVPANADVRLVEARVASADPARALAGLALSLGLGAPPAGDLYTAERALLDGYRVAPLFHLPVVYGVSARVKGGTGITPLGEWRFENLWVEGGR